MHGVHSAPGGPGEDQGIARAWSPSARRRRKSTRVLRRPARKLSGTRAKGVSDHVAPVLRPRLRLPEWRCAAGPHGSLRLPQAQGPDNSILIMNVHPSALVDPPGPTTAEPFSTEVVRDQDRH